MQINRDHAPPTGWEEFTVETRPGPNPGDAHDFVHLKSVHGKCPECAAYGTAQWNRDHAPPGGWEDIQFVPYSTQNQESATTQSPEPAPNGREDSIEIFEAVAGKPVRFKINNRPSSNDAWVGIYPIHVTTTKTMERKTFDGNGRDIDVNNASFPKQAAGSYSIQYSQMEDIRYMKGKISLLKLHQLTQSPKNQPGRRHGLLCPLVYYCSLQNSLFIMGLGGGFQYEAVSSGTFEIVDSDGQGDFGFEIFIEGCQVILMETVAIITVKILSLLPIILVVGLPLDHTVRMWPATPQMKVEKCFTRKLLAKAAETTFI